MPVYTYHCENCGHQFDKRQSFSESALKACPVCRKHRLRKVYSPAGVVFKGSGFYVTDSRKSSSGKVNSKKSKAASSKTKKEKVASTKSESKPATSKKEAS
jgi:putative FmdB family regulatory protein